MPAQPSSSAGRRPVDFVQVGLGGSEPEGVEAEGGDRAVRTGLEGGIRLARIGAAATTLRGISADLRANSSREALFTLLDGLERDIALASRQLLMVRQSAREHLDP